MSKQAVAPPRLHTPAAAASPVRESRGQRRARKRAEYAAARAARDSRPGPRGWNRRGGGWVPRVEPTPEWRGTTVQVCGMWPFAAGAQAPLEGVPLGPHQRGAGTVCADPIIWFLAGLINNPSGFVLGRPGLGKSSLVRHIANVLSAFGVIPLVLSDLRPDYVDLIDALGGKVLSLGPGRGHLNPLDPGPLAGQLDQLPARDRERARAEQHARTLNVTRGLCELVRGDKLTDREQTMLSVALHVVADTVEAPLLTDLVAVIQARHASVRAVALDRGADDRYDDATEQLVASLMSLANEHGPFGDLFARHTDQPLEMGVPAVFDLSAIDESDLMLQAGVQLACWSYGQAAVSAEKTLAAAGLRTQRLYIMVMDELWRMLKASPVMVDRLDDLTRLNRSLQLGQIMITHTMTDLKLATPEATEKAWSLVKHAEMVFLGGLAESEMGNLRQVFAMSEEEHRMITDWSIGADTVATTTGDGQARENVPPGRAKFLLKKGKASGVPFEVRLTETERQVNDTNKGWHEAADRHAGRTPRAGVEMSTDAEVA